MKMLINYVNMESLSVLIRFFFFSFPPYFLYRKGIKEKVIEKKVQVEFYLTFVGSRKFGMSTSYTKCGRRNSPFNINVVLLWPLPLPQF